MSSDPDSVEGFLSLVVKARNSGVASLAEGWLKGWRPKTPTPRHEAIGRLIDHLDPEGRSALVECVRNFIDLSLFNLLEILEMGERGVEFELSMSRSGAEGRTVLIDQLEDRELRSQFFLAIDAEGL